MKMRKISVLAVFIGCFSLFFSMCFPMAVRAESLITIETNKKYEGMKRSFSKGYEPSIEKNTMNLVVPFVTKQELEDDKIVVGVSFEREENSPFYYKNYQKKVKKSQEGVYLYQCRIQLKEDRMNGQYPIYLYVQAQTQEEIVQQDFTIYVEITDGKVQAHTGTQENPSEGMEPGQSGFPGDLPGQSGTEEVGGEGTVQPDISSGASSGEEAAHQPRILIDSNSLQGNSLLAGDSILWNLSAKNCSKGQSVENLKVTLLSESKDISFEKTSWYFQQAGPGKSLDLSQNITVRKKAAPENISIQYQFDYEDKKGNSYNSTETVTLLVSQPQQAELTDLSFPENVYESDRNSFKFQVQNTGLATIYNAKVRLEGKGLFPEKEMFLGNLEAGTSQEGEIQVFVGTLNMDSDGKIIEEGGEKYGDTLGSVIFSYENDQGELIEQKTELHTVIQKPQTVNLKIKKEPESVKTNQWWITIIIFVIIGLVLLIIWLYLRMKYYKNLHVLERDKQSE